MKRSDSILQQFYMSKLPKAQTGGGVLPGYATPLPRSTDVPGKPKPVMQMTMAESARENNIARAFNNGTIKPSTGQSAISKAVSIAANPMTAASYVVKGQRIPDNFDMAGINNFELATGIVNPANYFDQFGKFVKGAADVVRHPFDQSLESIGKLGLHALGSVPLVGELSMLNKYLSPAFKTARRTFRATGDLPLSKRINNAVNSGTLEFPVKGDIASHGMYEMSADQVRDVMAKEITELPKGAFTTDPNMSKNSAPLFWGQAARKNPKEFTIIRTGQRQPINWSGTYGKRVVGALPKDANKYMPEIKEIINDVKERINYLKNLGDAKSLAEAARLEKEGIASAIVAEMPDVARNNTEVRDVLNRFMENYKPVLDKPIIEVNRKTGLNFPLTSIEDKGIPTFYQPSIYGVKGNPLNRVLNYAKERAERWYLGDMFKTPIDPALANQLPAPPQYLSLNIDNLEKGGPIVDPRGQKNYKVGKSSIQGVGAFANKNLKPGDYIGKVHTINQPFVDYDFTELGKSHNHSDNPNIQNVLIGNERHVVATRPIKKGEELTSNYRLQPDLEQPEDFQMMQEGGEYKGVSIVDYLATKGYSGSKAFRKELANQYGVEDYDFSAEKNTELLSKLRANDDILESNKQTMAPVSVERINELLARNKSGQQTSQPTEQAPAKSAARENFNALRRKITLEMGFDPFIEGKKIGKLEAEDLSLASKNPNAKNSLVNGLQGTGSSAPVKPNVPTKPLPPSDNRYAKPVPGRSNIPSFQQFPEMPSRPEPAPQPPRVLPPSDNRYVKLVSGRSSFPAFNQFPEIPSRPVPPSVAPIILPPSDNRYVKPAQGVSNIPTFQQFPAMPARQLGEISGKTTAKTAAAKLKNSEEAEQGFFDYLGDLGQEGVEYVQGLFDGAQRKVESMQDEDERSVKKVKVLPGKPAATIPYGYKELYTVPDVNRPKDSLVAFTNTFDNDAGGRYYIGHKAKEVTDAGAQKTFGNARAVAHFLRDSDILPGQKITPQEWTVSKGYKYHTTSPGKTVSAAGFDDPERFRTLYKPDPSGDGSYRVKYVKNKEITPQKAKELEKQGWQLDFTVNAQHKYSDIAWDKEGPSTGYAAKSKWLPLKNGSHTYIPYKNKDGFSRFSGGSLVYLFKDPRTGKSVGVDGSGSVNTMKQIGDDIIKTYGVKPEDLEIAYHDMGSYSAKPKARGDKLDYDQWLDYNRYNRGFSGAPLIIPIKQMGGPFQSVDNTYVKKPRTDMLTMADYQAQKAIANQPVIRTPVGPQLSQEEILRRNKSYAQQTGKKFNEKTGAVENRYSASTDKMLKRAADNIIQPAAEIEMMMSGANLVGAGLKSAGKHIANSAAFKNIKSYGKDFIEASRNAGGLRFPQYYNIYRWQADVIPESLEQAGKTLSAEQQGLTGRWFTWNQNQIPFYMRTRPGAGNLEILRLPKVKIDRLAENMPRSAKGMSGKSAVAESDNQVAGELILPRQMRNNATSIRFDTNPTSYVADEELAQLRNRGISPESMLYTGTIEHKTSEFLKDFLKSKNKNIVGIPRKYFPFQDGGEPGPGTQSAMNEGAAWLQNWYKQRMQQPQFKEVAQKRYDLMSQRPGVMIDDKDLAKDRAEAAYDPVKDEFIIPSTDTRGSTDPSIWAHEFNHRAKFKAPQDFDRGWVKGYSKNFLNSREAYNKHGMPRSSFMYIRNPYETEAFLTAFRKEANLDPNKSYSKEEMLEKMKPYIESPSYKDIRKQSYDEQKQHSIKRFLQLMDNDPEKMLYLHNGIVGNDRGNMVPMAKAGGQTRNEREMVNGIADILAQVRDRKNRAEIARNMVGDFNREDVQYDYEKFMRMSKLQQGGQFERPRAVASSTNSGIDRRVANQIAAQGLSNKKAEQKVQTLINKAGYSEAHARRAVRTKEVKANSILEKVNNDAYRIQMHPDFNPNKSVEEQSYLLNDNSFRTRVLRGANMMTNTGNPVADFAAGMFTAPGRSFANLTMDAGNKYSNPNNTSLGNFSNFAVDVVNIAPSLIPKAAGALGKVPGAINQGTKVAGVLSAAAPKPGISTLGLTTDYLQQRFLPRGRQLPPMTISSELHTMDDFARNVESWATQNNLNLDEFPSDFITRFSDIGRSYGLDLSRNVGSDIERQIRNLSSAGKDAFLNELILELPNRISLGELSINSMGRRSPSKPTLINRSGLTKEEVLKNAPTKDKDVISKMSEDEFRETVTKPTGEVVPYVGTLDFNTSGVKQLQNVTRLPINEYAEEFNSRLDLLNDIIEKNNTSGVTYKVKRLKPISDYYGRLEFETPAQGNIPAGETGWGIDVTPGIWRGEVEDIPNVTYYKSIPGISMTNTSSGVFSDQVARRGSGAYESINEYLKRLDLGRVKPGFNSQTEYSKGLWENAIKKGKAFGYYYNPRAIYGTMKSVLPYIGLGALGAGALEQKKQGGEINMMAKGGQHGGLDRWFAEKWVDVKTGKQCGRQEGEKRGYPACRPSKRVSSQTPKTSSEMSSAEKAKFTRTKTSSERIPYNHKRK